MEFDKKNKLRSYLNHLISTGSERCNKKITNPKTSNLLPRRSFILKPEMYVRKFIDKSLKQRIVVFPGLRGVGKTTLLFQTYRYLRDNFKIPVERLIYVDVGDLNRIYNASLQELFELYEQFFLAKPLEKTNESIILFLDEAHNDPSWLDFSTSLFNRSDGENNVLIFVSGSSALGLKSSVDASRRMIRDEVSPLNFQEYLYLKYRFLPPKKTAERIRIALDSDIESAQYTLDTVYNELMKKSSLENINLNKLLEDYLISGASPVSLEEYDTNNIFNWWMNIFDKVITQDIPVYSKIGQRSSSKVFAMLQYLANSLPPATNSVKSISGELDGMPEGTVFNILESLKMACLIEEEKYYSNNPLKRVARPPKYYFKHPNIRSVLLWNMGRLNILDSSQLGTFFEESVFNTLLLNLKKPTSPIKDLGFDDANQKGADFIIKLNSGAVPIECCWGSKGMSQVKKSMERVESKYGIILDSSKGVVQKDKILYVPKVLFFFF
ncbi:MAG: AAA family ATPase [Candidatus Pacearchaeota archaeon]|jgi:predicted AAA+ superfamily ATPase